eukprot:jgi/Mesvir1/7474/Mv19238-RA.1
MVSVLHPPFKDLGYVEKLVALDPVCTGAAAEVKAGATAFRDTIWGRVEDLTRKVAEASRNNAAKARQPESASKRLRTMLGRAEVESVGNTSPNWESLVAVGMIGSTELPAEGVASAQKSPREIAAEEDDIPMDVPEIPVAEQDSYIPARLRNPVLQARLAALENGDGRSQESDDDEDDPEVMAGAMPMTAPD